MTSIWCSISWLHVELSSLWKLQFFVSSPILLFQDHDSPLNFDKTVLERPIKAFVSQKTNAWNFYLVKKDWSIHFAQILINGLQKLSWMSTRRVCLFRFSILHSSNECSKKKHSFHTFSNSLTNHVSSNVQILSKSFMRKYLRKFTLKYLTTMTWFTVAKRDQ